MSKLGGHPAAAPAELFDPVADAAVEAASLAARMCPPDCSWYHGIWTYLRMLGVAATPDRHTAFFLQTLSAAARAGGRRRVLVSGTADHSMLAHVVRAYRSCGHEPEVTVLDRCPTPVALCRWYGGLTGLPVAPEVADIVGFEPREPFDLICTHSFLSQFPARRRPALLDTWRRALRPGGKLITTTRITPGGTDPQCFTAEQSAAFCERVCSEASRRQGSLGLSVEQVEAAARRYAGRTVAHPTASVEDVRDLLSAAGFGIERLEVTTVAGRIDNSGPGTGQPAEYAEVVAVRD